LKLSYECSYDSYFNPSFHDHAFHFLHLNHATCNQLHIFGLK
jgi:hypothetical protein